MAGLLIIGAYCFFWWLCWKFSGLFSRFDSTRARIRRTIVFLFIAALPYYYYLFEFVRYQRACEVVDAYITNEKIDNPRALITNKSYFNNSLGEFGGKFDFLISPKKSREIDFDKGVSQFVGYIVYPYEARRLSLEKENKLNIILNSRFGFFYNSIRIGRDITQYDVFIYDFEKKMKLSSYTTVKYQFKLHTIRHYLFPYFFEECEYREGKFKNFNYTSNSLFENTFKKRNDTK